MAIQPVHVPGSAAFALRPHTAESVPARTPAPYTQPARMTAEQVEQVVKEVRRIVEPVAQDIQFSIDDATGQTIVRVVDSATQEVIRQIPSAELVKIAHSIDKLLGLLVNKEA